MNNITEEAIYTEENIEGWEVRLKTSRTDIGIYWFSKLNGIELAKYNASVHREHLINALNDLMKS